MFLPFLISIAFAAEPSASPSPSAASTSPAATSSPVDLSKAAVFSALEKSKASEPLAGSFQEGAKLLKSADPVSEANLVFRARGASMITVCGFACLAPGVDAKEAAPGPSIPKTGDALNAENKAYNEAATDFAIRFNQRMAALKAPPKPFNKELSTKELTVGNVTLGKSNLYNPVGFFGTNMFKKKASGVSALCYIGDDGTTLVFAADPKMGRELVITDALVLSAGGKYDEEITCKPSKKVSKSLALAGVKLGDSYRELVSKKGEPTQVSEEMGNWQYQTESKKRTLSSFVEVTFTEDKITSVSLHHGEKR